MIRKRNHDIKYLIINVCIFDEKINSYTELKNNKMSNEIVKNWFDNEFQKLAQQLQELHIHGGKLSGDVNVSYGNGFATLVIVELIFGIHYQTSFLQFH